jgi:hypothetical protein
MITFGPCEFEAAEGAYKCTYEAGSCVSVISDFDLQTLCSVCKDPLSQHKDYEEGIVHRLYPYMDDSYSDR